MVSFNAQNAGKYITFSVPVKKELNNSKTITYKLKFFDSLRLMNTSISNLVDDLSEIYKKECKGCKERRKINSASDFIGFKSNKLNYECKICKEIWLKPKNGLIKKFPNTHSFAMETLINLFYYYEKVFIHMNTLIVGKI